MLFIDRPVNGSQHELNRENLNSIRLENHAIQFDPTTRVIVTNHLNISDCLDFSCMIYIRE